MHGWARGMSAEVPPASIGAVPGVAASFQACSRSAAVVLRVDAKRMRAVLMNGQIDQLRSFNGNCNMTGSSSRLRCRSVEVKGTAMARGFEAPLLFFRPSKGTELLSLQRVSAALVES